MLSEYKENILSIDEENKPIKVTINGTITDTKTMRAIRKELEAGPTYELKVKGSYTKEG